MTSVPSRICKAARETTIRVPAKTNIKGLAETISKPQAKRLQRNHRVLHCTMVVGVAGPRGVLQQSSALWRSVAAALLLLSVLGICIWRNTSPRQGVPQVSIMLSNAMCAPKRSQIQMVHSLFAACLLFRTSALPQWQVKLKHWLDCHRVGPGLILWHSSGKL